MNAFDEKASIRAASVVSTVSTAVQIAVMALLFWSVMPSLNKIISQGEAAAVKDQEQLEALDNALKRSIANQERNRLLLEETIKTLRAAKPPEDRP